jgi:hypothetical protein
MTTPDPDDVIRMDELLAQSARARGVDPAHPPRRLDQLVTGMIERVGPLVIYPNNTSRDLRWLAAGLDALARAADQAADAIDRDRRAEECRCVVSCADDPDTACSLSGIPHVHPDTDSDTFGPCPVHPDAPGDV